MLAKALYDRINSSFIRQGLMKTIGCKLVRVEQGCVEISLPYSEKITQQQGAFHGGAIGAIADAAGGYAALTAIDPELEVVSVEFKINLLANRRGGEIRGVGKVLRHGKRIVVTTADVNHIDDKTGETTLLAVMTQTLVSVPKKY